MPSGKNAWLTFLTFDLLIKIVILHALLAVVASLSQRGFFSTGDIFSAMCLGKKWASSLLNTAVEKD